MAKAHPSEVHEMKPSLPKSENPMNFGQGFRPYNKYNTAPVPSISEPDLNLCLCLSLGGSNQRNEVKKRVVEKNIIRANTTIGMGRSQPQMVTVAMPPPGVPTTVAESTARHIAFHRPAKIIKSEGNVYDNGPIYDPQISTTAHQTIYRATETEERIKLVNTLSESMVAVGARTKGKSAMPAKIALKSPSKKAKFCNCNMVEYGNELLKTMPSVITTGGHPNGRKIEGFLYKYMTGLVCIVCVCHGNFFSPAEFVKHAGGDDVPNPMKHITVATNFF